MGVPGVTIYHGKSHLQKYCLAKYLPDYPAGGKGSKDEKKGFGDSLSSLESSSVKFIYNTDAYRFQQVKFHVAQELLGKLHATAAGDLKSEAFNMLLKDLNDERQKPRDAMKKMFNESFGATFLVDTG